MSLISQNLKQSISVPFFFIIEGYRVFLAATPIIFVPQICNEELCSPMENYRKMPVIGVGFHISTVVCFIVAYGTELYREYWCIKNLDVDSNLPESRLLCPEITDKLKPINKYYVYSWFITATMFFINTTYASIYLSNHLIKSGDAFVAFTSYLLSVGQKFTSVSTTVRSVLSNASTISESAYLKKAAIYNVKESFSGI